MNTQCGSQGFAKLFERFSKGGQCSTNLLCSDVNRNSSESDRLTCGAKLASHFMVQNMRSYYPAIANPCKKQAPARMSNLIQTHFMKVAQTINTTTNATSNTTSSKYVNEASLTPAEKTDLQTTISAAKDQTNVNASIDSNTHLAPNTNVNNDMKQISGVVAPPMANKSSGFFMKFSGLVILLSMFLI